MIIDGSVAIVTGGGGMLGAATADRLADLGASVLIADLHEGRAPGLVEKHDSKVRFVATDVTDEASVGAAVHAAQELGPVRILVNCAGAGIVKRTLSRDGERHDLNSFRFMLELNLVGTFNMITHGAAAMGQTEPLDDGERGVIVNTASLAGLEGSAGQVAYGAAKAGVAGLTLPAARDLAPLGIRVVAIAPGGMAEPGFDASEPRLAMMLAQVPHPKRFGTPSDFALLVTQIVENPYLNGDVVRLDGGARLGMKY